MKNFPYKYFFAAALFLGVPLILFAGGLRPGMMLGGYDIVTLGMPFRAFAREMLVKYHQMPLWLPDIFLGIPLIGSSNLIYFYPLNFIMLLPAAIHHADSILMIIHMPVAAFGMYLFISRCGVSKKSSAAGAFVYMLSPFILTLTAGGQLGVIQAAALLPYTFYFLKRGVDEGLPVHFLSAGIFLAMESLCLMFQLAVYNAFAMALYLAFEMAVSGRTRKKDVFRYAVYFILCGVMTFLISAPQSLPSGEYMARSWRKLMDMKSFTWGSLVPKDLVSLILPDSAVLAGETPNTFIGLIRPVFYMGILPLVMMPFAFLSPGLKSRAIFWSVISVFFLALALGGHTPLYHLFLNIPVFSSFRIPSRFAFITFFGAAFLTAAGLDNFFDPANREGSLKILRTVTSALAVGAAILLVAAVLHMERLPALVSWLGGASFREGVIGIVAPSVRGDVFFFTGISACIIVVLWMQLSGKPDSGAILLSALMLVHGFDASRVDKKYIRFLPAGNMRQASAAADFLKQDKGVFRVFVGTKGAIDNLNIYHGLETLQGYHGNAPYKMVKILDSGLFAKMDVRRRFNIKYYIDYGGEKEGLKEVYAGPPSIYRDDRAYGRFYISDKPIGTGSESEELSTMNALDPANRGVVVGRGVDAGNDPVKLDYNISVVSYTPNETLLRVAVNKKAVLVNSSQLFSSSRVKVDGRAERLFEVNYIASGLLIDKGVHDVEFYTSKASIIWGIAFAALGIVIYLIFAIFYETFFRFFCQKKKGGF